MELRDLRLLLKALEKIQADEGTDLAKKVAEVKKKVLAKILEVL